MQKQIIETLLNLFMEKGWAATTLQDVAEVLNRPVEEVILFLPSKERGFHLFSDYIEKGIFNQLPPETIDAYSEKEQTMEILINKLEAMTPFKSFLIYLRGNFLSLTDLTLPFIIAELASLDRILNHYQFPHTTLVSEIKRKGLFGVYLLTLDTWVQDDTPDLGPTLAKLDTLLSKGETFLERYA